MLSIGIVSATGGQYYAELARSDYYVAGGESPGMWHVNEASFQFGFHGVVDKQQIERLFDGYHPKTGEPLAKNHGRDDRRAALRPLPQRAEGRVGPVGGERRCRPPPHRAGF